MTRPADITLLDEMRSLQMWLSLEFPDDEIRRSRPDESETYDMIIEMVDVVDNARGTYMTETTLPVVIQRWCDSYDIALGAAERIRRLFRKGKVIEQQGTRADGSAVITGVVVTGLQAGMFVRGQGIPDDTKITSVGVGQFTMSANATSDGTSSVTTGYQGNKSRVPVWKFGASGSPDEYPDPALDTPDRFLRVDDLEVRVLPADEPTKFVAVCDVRLNGWRIIFDHTDQLVEFVQVDPDSVT